MNGETHGGYQIIVATDLEVTVALIGFLIDSNLVIQQLLSEDLRFGSPWQMKPPGLEKSLKA